MKLELKCALRQREEKHLRFEIYESKSKTKVYQIYSNEDNSLLGEIRWHGGWRQYVCRFHPESIWSDGCLKELYDFMQTLREERLRRGNEQRESQG